MVRANISKPSPGCWAARAHEFLSSFYFCFAALFAISAKRVARGQFVAFVEKTHPSALPRRHPWFGACFSTRNSWHPIPGAPLLTAA
jgi:hypothetical protein